MPKTKILINNPNLLRELAKTLWLTILLAFLLWGLGHMYLGFTKRGIIILVIGIFSLFSAIFFIPFPYSWIIIYIIIGYWIWQIWDAYKHYKKLNVGEAQVTK